MRMTTLATVLITGLLSPALFADWQDQAPKGSLINQLQTAYPLTIMDATGYKVSKPGTIFEIQLDGIQANPMKSPPFAILSKTGKLSPEAIAQYRGLCREDSLKNPSRRRPAPWQPRRRCIC